MAATPRPGKPTLSLLAGFLVLVATLAGTLALARRDHREVPAYRLIRSVNAFHIISPEDVGITTVAAGSEPAPAKSVVGRLMLHSGKPGKTLHEDDLGVPPPPTVLVPNARIIGIPVSSAQAMAGRIEQGSTVILTMSEPPHEALYATLLDLIAQSKDGDPQYVMVIAVANASDGQLSQMALGRVAVTVAARR